VAADWAFDEVAWQSVNVSRFQTGYFERKLAEGMADTERLLLRLQAVQPDSAESYRQLVRLHAYTQRWDKLHEIAEVMRIRRPSDPDGSLFLGLALHMQYEDERAAAAFARGIEAMDDSRRTDFVDVRRFVAAEDSAGIRDPDAYATSFWASRDPRLLSEVNERMTEHYARRVLADLLFDAPDRVGSRTMQGDLIVRYGLPFNAAAVLSPYGIAGDMKSGSFKTWQWDDWQIMLEDPFRSGEFRPYSPPASAYSQVDSRGVPVLGGTDYETEARVRRRDVPERYVHQDPGRRVDLPYTITVFADSAIAVRDNPGSDIVVTYGIPIDSDAPETGVLPDSLETGVFLSDRSGVRIAQTAPVLGLSADAINRTAATRLWTGISVLSAPAGSWGITIEFETEDRSSLGWSRDSVHVPVYHPDSLALSDLLLAYLVEESDSPTGPGTFVRNDLAIRPAPWNVFDVGQPIYIYFEAYGLQEDAPGRSSYEVEAVLVPADTRSGFSALAARILGRDSNAAVSVRFELAGSAPVDAQYLILVTQGVAPGDYQLQLTIHEGASMRRAVSSRTIRIVGPD
jgi:GWxTD domain-containing protein